MSSSVTNSLPANTLSCPSERSTATFAISRRTRSPFRNTTSCLSMSTDRHTSGKFAASSQERHTRPTPMRTSTTPSLTKIEDNTSRGSDDQSLADGAASSIDDRSRSGASETENGNGKTVW